MTTVMADDQYTERLVANEAKLDRVGESMHETPAKLVFDSGKLEGVFTNARDGRIHLRPKLVTESSTLPVVVRDGVIEI